ncbi:unnamed protein product [Rotaria sordida]|uniref:Schwannomin interacting protein 1 C-terminal domain-containing protein n=1 Tax=Rotaria sordida TaxID=392033 RepID=A0A818T0T0_9BILA|nr:unnamed protein product [Rotaria sordida]CAF3676268.1 unnamed protein product [Rotaria sordida]
MSETNENVSHEGKSSTSSSDFLHEYLQKTNLSTTASLNQFIKDHHISRDENETDEAFTKRVKKINYLNLAQQLIRSSSQNTNTRQIIKPELKSLNHESSPKLAAPLKRMKPVFSPAEDPDFDDEFEIDDNNSRDIYDESSSSSNEDDDDDDDDIHLQQPRSVPFKTNHTFANDIKQKLSNLAADVVRTFGTSNMIGDDDLTKPLPTNISFSSRLFSNRIKETNNQNNSLNNDNYSMQELPSQINNNSDIIPDNNNDDDDADLLYTNESLLPQVDWENLEKQLKQAQIERERYDKARLNDRDEIRRKLAAGNESEGENEDYYTSDYIKKTMVTTSHRRRQGSNLQICFVNEHHQANESFDNDATSTTLSTPSKNLKSDEINSSTIGNNDEDILTKQQRLKEEARVALVLGAKMARMQVQIERRALKKKKSPLYDIIGINTNDDKPLTVRMLEDMNIGQLQVLVNDLHCQIEAHNEELVSLLMERDSLSMEQDSVLVDIEDLTKRLQERAASFSSESKRTSTNGAAQRVYIVKSPTTQQQDVQKKSILHNLLRKATFT